ncbi:HK97 gp10 family phage protein [Fructilactobacillus myrtifloralis]|uniref:HK97 gp10 family phage protein n=1 Tax=Fructilactobacillus myrtifloralis TaxID=2940301 RepID=A0ABY5BN35_9LACO|nr:HK97-gp10 family putative phage morphogenesis protein [Fructilactobacillus myrtifloralis]USS85080.1 HK97 gp10 family phage protein [Fructilactobacillus myrtifloralis]
MDDLDAQLAEMQNMLSKVVPDTERKTQITQAGAKVLKSNLEKTTRQKHYRKGEHKHLADNVVSQAKDIDNIKNGNSIVGFNYDKTRKIDWGVRAMFLNNGTSHHLVGDHFVDEVVNNSKADIFKAMVDEYQHTGGGN